MACKPLGSHGGSTQGKVRTPAPAAVFIEPLPTRFSPLIRGILAALACDSPRYRCHSHPLALVLILLLELGGAPAWQLHALGAALILGRIVHAWSLPAQSGNGRLIGMTLTIFVLAAGALGNLKAALGAMVL